MLLADLVTFITVIGVIAVAVERSNEIIINAFNLDDKLEDNRKRRLVYHLMGAVTGSIVYYFNGDYQLPLLSMHFNEYVASILAGLMVSGGSGIWHDLLKFVSNLSIKKQETLL